ncbi:hypothetical protein SLS58_011050 [Diplodia intermedia]|uniref:Uncharacterized protein n=1 Tax=Diplodia intermedia TaxID=856260 RepID=A0ABR3T1T1_9PEZI
MPHAEPRVPQEKARHIERLKELFGDAAEPLIPDEVAQRSGLKIHQLKDYGADILRLLRYAGYIAKEESLEHHRRDILQQVNARRGLTFKQGGAYKRQGSSYISLIDVKSYLTTVCQKQDKSSRPPEITSREHSLHPPPVNDNGSQREETPSAAQSLGPIKTPPPVNLRSEHTTPPITDAPRIPLPHPDGPPVGEAEPHMPTKMEIQSLTIILAILRHQAWTKRKWTRPSSVT